ncbi:hypothetical protein QEN19_003419 [Hanseniaspora menglaensis]
MISLNRSRISTSGLFLMSQHRRSLNTLVKKNSFCYRPFLTTLSSGNYGKKLLFSTNSIKMNKKISDSPPKVATGNLTTKESVKPNSTASLISEEPSTKESSEEPITHELLAIKEQEANRSLSDSKVQADFYKLLLKSGYAQYIISRYETPGIATSPECMGLYMEALTIVGRHVEANNVRQILLGNNGTTEKGSAAATSNASNATSDFNTSFQNNGHTQGQQASAATPIMTPMFGTAKEPMHVILTESTFTMVFRVVKYIVTLGLTLYLLNEGFKFVTENSTLFKNNEVSDNAIDTSKANVKFEDVAGVDEARAELEEIVDFLRDPAKYEALGGKLPKGVLLTGPPGTGKTLLARATAGEAGVDFFFMSGSEFDEVYVGVGAKRIRDLFKQARARAPAIIFIDELDAIGGKRNPKDQAYAKQTLNQLLVELDGFEQTQGIIVIGATNFPESLDKALTRPGRFDKMVTVGLPDIRGRSAILKQHMKKITTAKDVNIENIAKGTTGFSGAQLSSLINQAAVYACQQNANAVDMSHMEWAKDKILLGAEKKTMVLPEATRKATAYHEAGHAIMALYTKHTEPLYKATILPRGNALGVTFQLPEADKYDITKAECLARLDVCMGGKAAEEVIFGKEHTTSGCGSDLRSATKMARNVVTSYGMNEKVGPVELTEDWGMWSGKVKDLADQEVIQLLKESEERSRQLLKSKDKEFRRLAEALIDYETLDRAEMDKVIKGESLDRPKFRTNSVVDTPESDGRRKIEGIAVSI